MEVFYIKDFFVLCMYSVDNRKRLNVYHNAACDGSIKCTEIIWAQGYAWDGYKFWDGPHVLNIKRLTTNVLLLLKLVEYITLINRVIYILVWLILKKSILVQGYSIC